MKQVNGLVNAAKPKPPTPPPSPKDFVWPSQKDHDDAIAQKIAASLQELLPKKEMSHGDLARTLWGINKDGQARNLPAARAWLTGEHPIPNEKHAAYVAQVLDVPMARLLEPEGKFDPHPALIRKRSPNGVNLWRSGKRVKTKDGTVLVPKDKTPSGRDREKQRAYNAAYRERQRAAAKGKPAELSWYKKNKLKAKGKHAKTNGASAPAESGNTWTLAEGVDAPEFVISSEDTHPGHVKLEVKATLPHERAMAILHILQHIAPPEE